MIGEVLHESSVAHCTQHAARFHFTPFGVFGSWLTDGACGLHHSYRTPLLRSEPLKTYISFAPDIDRMSPRHAVLSRR